MFIELKLGSMRKYLICLLGAGLFLVGCKKEQPQMSALSEGCDCAKEVSADFLMEEAFGYQFMSDTNHFFKTNTDTSFAAKNVIFTALEKNAEYTWYIGSEILTGEQVARYFDLSHQFTNIPITLVVRKKPNFICLPNDDGYDSIVKNIYFKSKDYDIDTTLLEGTYRLKGSHLSDSIDMTIDYVPGEPFQGISMYFDVYNYDGLGNNSIHINPALMNYRECFSKGHVWGKFKLGLDGVAVFRFQYYGTYYYYKGRKL